jgi:hypothetical protein
MSQDNKSPDALAGFPPSALVAIAAGGALLLALVVAWLGIQWTQTTAELRAVESSLKTARDSLRDRRQALRHLQLIADRDEVVARQRAAVAASRREPGRRGNATDQSVAAAAFMAPTKQAAEEPAPLAAAARAATKPSSIETEDTETTDLPAPSTDISATAEKTKAPGPQLLERVAGRLKGMKGKPVVVAEGLAGPLPPDAITLSLRSGAAGIVPCDIVFKKGSNDGELRISGKRVATIGQSKETLTLELPSSPGDSQWLMDYLVLELRLQPNAGTSFVPLGEPSTATLDVHDAQADATDNDKVAFIDRRSRYEIFSDDDANSRMTRLLEAYPDLYESLEFAPGDLVSEHGKTSKTGKSTRGFTLVNAEGIGFQLRRVQASPPNYQWSGFVFPLQYGLLNDKYKGVKVFTEDLLSEIPRALNDEIESTYSYRHRNALENAGRRDKESFGKAENFPIDSLRGKRVRLTFKKPSVDGGFVVVDSLGSSSPPSPQGAP